MKNRFGKTFCNNKILELCCVKRYDTSYRVFKCYFFVWITKSYDLFSPAIFFWFFFRHIGLILCYQFAQQLFMPQSIVALTIHGINGNAKPGKRLKNIIFVFFFLTLFF